MPVPLPTILGVYYGYVWVTYRGRKSGNIFTFKDSAPETDPANDALKAGYVAAGLVSAWNSNLMARYPTGTTGTDARVYALGHNTIPAVYAHASASGAGGSADCPTAAAAVIRHSVFRRGKGSQSHSAISPLTGSEITPDGDSVTGAFITNMDTDFGNFIGGVQAAFTASTGGDTLTYVQLSKRHSQVFTITGSATEALLGTERSRTARP